MADKTPPTKDEPNPNALADAIGKAMADALKSTREDARGLSPEQRERLEKPPEALKWREVKCRSEETGATFLACVVESRSMVAGRIVQLKNYRLPQGSIVYRAAGGLVPDGMPIMRDGGAPAAGTDPNTLRKQELEVHYHQWRYVEFWQKDINYYVGRELRASFCVTPGDFSTSWKDGAVHVDLSEAV